MKIIHFSDPHFGGWPSSRSAFFDKRIVGALNYNLLRKSHFNYEILRKAIAKIISLEPQYVIITGDISSIGDPKEFEMALDYLYPLIKSPTIKLLYVPGNHDIYVRNKKNSKLYADFFATVNGFELSELPMSIRSANVNFVLMNQAIPTVPFMSSGILDAGSIELLKQEKIENEIRIGVGHFPIATALGKPLSARRCLYGADIIKEHLNLDLDLYLCGHIHKPFINSYSHGKEICAGSITASAHLNVLEINQVETTIEQRWEIVQDDNDEIEKIIQPDFNYSIT